MDDPQTRDELNRRYWESDASVSEIADELDISRRALYDGIEPLPAGVPCPACGGMLGFRNRTAAENQAVECAECGRELALGDVRGAAGGAGAQSAGAQSGKKQRANEQPADAQSGRRRTPRPPEQEQERSAAAMSPVRRVPDAGNGMAIGGLVLLGVVVAALTAYLVRQRG